MDEEDEWKRRDTMKQTKKPREIFNTGNGGVMPADPGGMALSIIPADTYPVELYAENRIARFDEADCELARLLRGKKR